MQLQLCTCTLCSAATRLIGCGAGSNRCACLLKLHKLDKALADAQQCVSLRGDWDKAHYRVGSALEALGRHAEVRRPVSHCVWRVPLLATTQQRKAVTLLPSTAAAVCRPPCTSIALSQTCLYQISDF